MKSKFYKMRKKSVSKKDGHNAKSKYRLRRFYRDGTVIETFRNTKSGAYSAKQYHARLDKRYKSYGGCYRTTITKVK